MNCIKHALLAVAIGAAAALPSSVLAQAADTGSAAAAKPAAGEMTEAEVRKVDKDNKKICLLYTSPSPRDGLLSRMPSSA